MDLSPEERDFFDAAERRILDHARRRRAAGRTDVIHAVVRSTSGDLYDAIPLETSTSQFDCCAERCAINDLRQAEPGDPTVDAVLIAGPVPAGSDAVTTPCGACRHVIHEFGPDATVYCASFVREDEGWTTFPTVERYTPQELYAHHDPGPVWE